MEMVTKVQTHRLKIVFGDLAMGLVRKVVGVTVLANQPTVPMVHVVVILAHKKDSAALAPVPLDVKTKLAVHNVIFGMELVLMVVSSM